MLHLTYLALISALSVGTTYLGATLRDATGRIGPNTGLKRREINPYGRCRDDCAADQQPHFDVTAHFSSLQTWAVTWNEQYRKSAG